VRSFLLRCAALAAVPSAAVAHGDHDGPVGFLHILGSPDHLGLVLLAGAAASLLTRRASVMLRRSMKERACRRKERSTTI
jgi:hypothetical protein